MRFGGCAKVEGDDMAFIVKVMCRVQGDQEQCKQLSGKQIKYPLQLLSDGIKWGGDYHLVPLEGGDPPAPQPKKDGKQKSYSDREVK